MMKQDIKQLHGPYVLGPPIKKKDKRDVMNVWEGEGGKPASLHNTTRGFGVFIDTSFKA
jgi:hypothetical protein